MSLFLALNRCFDARVPSSNHLNNRQRSLYSFAHRAILLRPHKMADPATIILSLPTVIDLCLRLGNSLLTTLTTFRHPHSHSRLHQFTLDLTKGSIHDILFFFKNHSQDFYPNLAMQLYEVAMVLAEILDEVTMVSNRAPHCGDEGGRIKLILRRLRYALWDARKIKKNWRNGK